MLQFFLQMKRLAPTGKTVEINLGDIKIKQASNQKRPPVFRQKRVFSVVIVLSVITWALISIGFSIPKEASSILTVLFIFFAVMLAGTLGHAYSRTSVGQASLGAFDATVKSFCALLSVQDDKSESEKALGFLKMYLVGAYHLAFGDEITLKKQNGEHALQKILNSLSASCVSAGNDRAAVNSRVYDLAQGRGGIMRILTVQIPASVYLCIILTYALAYILLVGVVSPFIGFWMLPVGAIITYIVTVFILIIVNLSVPFGLDQEDINLQERFEAMLELVTSTGKIEK